MNSTVCIEVSDDSAQNVSGGFSSNRNSNITLRVNKTFDSTVRAVGQASDADAFASAYGPNSLAEVNTYAITTAAGSEAYSNSIAFSAGNRRVRPTPRH
jgi:hypothetical protein